MDILSVIKKRSDVWAVSNIYDCFSFNNAKYSQALQDRWVVQISDIISSTRSAHSVQGTNYLYWVVFSAIGVTGVFFLSMSIFITFGNKSKDFLKRWFPASTFSFTKCHGNNVRCALCMRHKLKGTSRHHGQDNVVADESDPNPRFPKVTRGRSWVIKKSDVLNQAVRSLKWQGLFPRVPLFYGRWLSEFPKIVTFTGQGV